jgi:HK97 family phage major capsid protein
VENLNEIKSQISEVLDAKIEKAFNQAQDNAKGQVDSVLNGEIKNLTEQVVGMNERLDQAEVAAKKSAAGAEPKSFKGSLLKALKEGAVEGLVKGDSNAARFEIKAGDMTMANSYTGVVAAEQVISDIKFDPSRRVHIRQLIPNGSTDAQTIRYPKESAYDNGAATAAQGATLGQSDFDITASSVNMEKLGTFMRITEEMLNDTPQLLSYLSARVPEKILSLEDSQILNGDGTSPNLDGLFTDGAAFAAGGFAAAIESANEYDVLVAALNQLALSNYGADTILVNPTDLHKIALLKSTANEYLRQQIYSGLQPNIMGVPVTASTAVSAGSFLVGNLAVATQLWIRENLAIEFSREDSTNFRDGFVTVKASERVGLTTYLPNAIVQGTFSVAKAALETA